MASDRRRHGKDDSRGGHRGGNRNKYKDRNGKDSSRSHKLERKPSKFRTEELREQLIRGQKVKQRNGRKSSKSFSPQRKKRKLDSPPSERLKRKKLDDAQKQTVLGKTFLWLKDGKKTEVVLQRIIQKSLKMEIVVVSTKETVMIPLKELGRNLVRTGEKASTVLHGVKRKSTSAERSPIKKRKLSSEESDTAHFPEDEESDLGMSGTEEPDSSHTEIPSSPVVGTALKDWDPKVRGCRFLEDSYVFLNDIDEGAYGMVSRHKDKFTGEIVALKRIKMEQSQHGFPKSSLREISCLLQLRHPNIVEVKEALVSKHRNRHVYMAMEYCEHDFRALMLTRKFPWSKSEIKCLMQQLISGVAFMHDHYIFHRDLKTSNLLLTDDGHLKICDFGMARKFGSPIKKYTSLVVTLWYRAPEILLQEKPLYTQAVDLWSVGCILAEFFLNTPVFKAQEETGQIEKILDFLGTPSKEDWPDFHSFPSVQKLRKKYRSNFRQKLPIAGSALANNNKIVLDDSGLELLLQLLRWDPAKRITAVDALNHPWFRQKPLPVNRELLPTFPSLNKEVRQKALRKARKEAAMLKQELAGGFHM